MVGDSRLHVLQNVAHVRLVQRHVLVQYFQLRRQLCRLGRDGSGGGACIERSPSIYAYRGRDGEGDGRRVVAGGDGRPGDRGRVG